MNSIKEHSSPVRRFTITSQPYLPFLNPIEECFSVVKSRVKNLIDYEFENCTATWARQEDDLSGLGGLLPHVHDAIWPTGIGSNDHHTYR